MRLLIKSPPDPTSGLRIMLNSVKLDNKYFLCQNPNLYVVLLVKSSRFPR